MSISPRLLRILVAETLLAACVAPADAQFAYSLEAGGTSVSYNETSYTNGLSLAPSAKLDMPRASVYATSNLSVFDAGGWSAQGLLTASLFTAPARPVRGELAVTASGIAFEHTSSMIVLAEGRAHVPWHSGGVWAGGGVGAMGSAPTRSAVLVAEAGGWWHHGRLSVDGSLTRSQFRSRDAVVPGDSLVLAGNVVVPTWRIGFRTRVLNDAVATLHYETGSLELDASAGARLASGSDAAQQWGSLGGTWWLTHTTAITVRGGSDPANLVQGFPSVRYLAVGLKLTPTRARAFTATSSPAPATSAGLAAVRGATFALHTGAGQRRTLRIDAPGASRVELMGDFTGWSPRSLSRGASGAWELTLDVPPGTYRIAVRYDGGAWAPPPGVATQTDEFGGTVGVVVLK